MSKRIEIVVDPKGSSTVETKGFTGSECVEASKFIENAIGQSGNMRTTSEFFRAQNSQTQQVSSNE